MFTLMQQFPASASLALSTILLLGSGAAHAQTASPPSNTSESACQATTDSANGNADDANLDGTYSACRLVNGAIGYSTRTNAGTSAASEFEPAASDQVLRQPRVGEQNHRLSNFSGEQDIDGATSRLRPGRSDGNYRFGTRDFVSAAQEQPIEDAGYRGGRYLAAATSEQYAPVTSARLAEPLPTGDTGGVGSGGAGGGLDSGSNGGNGLTTPVIPAVPEPGTWAMLLAGLGLLAVARRGKASAKA